MGGQSLDIIDLPGLYSLTPSNPAEVSSRDFLLAGGWDVLINVLDASQLARSLELTLELKDLGRPMVICLNMMDEATRKGEQIDSAALSSALGAPVVEAVGSRGQGTATTFRKAIQLALDPHPQEPGLFVCTYDFETVLQKLERVVHCGRTGDGQGEGPGVRNDKTPPLKLLVDTEPGGVATTANCPDVFPASRFQTLFLLQSDPRQLREQGPVIAAAVQEGQDRILEQTGRPADVAIATARHAACLELFEAVVKVRKPSADWREKIDRVVMHPVLAYVTLTLVLLGFFHGIFDLGKLVENPILKVFDSFVALLAAHFSAHGLWFAVIKGAVLGTAGAVATVMPYLVPFLVGLAILEDIGYLPRVGYLMDAAMHRIGLHGTAMLPVLLGYGCSVPAVMATRILSSRRDRFVATFLAVLVPCSARMTVIMALTGFYLGANWALGIYLLNVIVVVLAGHTLRRIWPEVSPGMLMEVPPYRRPSPKVVLLKTWWRLREFVLVAVPLLVVGSAVMSAIDYFGWEHAINAGLGPLTSLLGLPKAVGLTLIFGVLRKELSLLMLMQSLGTTHVQTVMTAAQIFTFTLFVTFYIPCLATLASMFREVGAKLTIAASATLLLLAVAISLVARAAFLFV